MVFKIVHHTNYDFDQEVYIEPHYLRFKPRMLPNNSLISVTLSIFPLPEGLSEQNDTENNDVYFCWFSGLYPKLHIQSEVVLEINQHNPFNFLIFPSNSSDIPFKYGPQQAALLYAALKVPAIQPPLIAYGAELLHQAEERTINFISELTRHIHQDFTLVFRLEGAPFDPDETFRRKSGSCRDLAWMQIAILRHYGVAARFVSGYFFVESDKPEYDLHGWIEVFLPGAGWLGFDPANGIAAGSNHIPVCASAFFQNTMPVTGSVRGDAKGTLETYLTLEKC